MKDITFITGNLGKWEVARDVFANYKIKLLQERLETPEIQSLHVEEVAQFSAQWAATKLNKPVIKSDVGHYITALNGFPGPFIKYTNMTLTADDILRLMHGQSDRSIILRECLAFASPTHQTHSFISEQKCTIAEYAAGEGSSIDQILVLEGMDKPKGTYAPDIIFEHWKKTLNIYHDMAKYLEGI